MTDCILNVADIEYRDWGHGDQFAAKLGAVGARVGARKLGYNVTAVPPGKRAFPLHNHHVNEEMFFVLEGEGELRVGPERYALCAGDIVACPPGGPDTAHQIINTSSTAELKYLAVSTNLSPEVVDYPDSGKFGIRLDLPAGPDGKPGMFRFIGRAETSGDYWEGE